MALNARQSNFYRYTVDVYRQVDPDEASDGQVSDRGFYALSSTGVLCLYESTPDFDEMTELGMVKETNLFTTDLFHFSIDADITAFDYIHATGGNFADGLMGRWWSILGISQVHNTLAMTRKQRVYANISDAPPVVVSSLSVTQYDDGTYIGAPSPKYIPSARPRATFVKEEF